MKFSTSIIVFFITISFFSCGSSSQKIVASNEEKNEVKVVEISKELPHGSDDWGPYASPDGKTVAFYSMRKGTSAGRILTVDATGGTIKALPYAQTDAHDIEPHWTSDGKQIVFTAQYNGDEHGNVSSHINIMNADGSNMKLLYDHDGAAGNGATHFGAWIEEGKRFVYFYWPYSAFKPNIYAVDIDGTNLKQLTSDNGSFRPNYVDGKIWFHKNDGAYVMDVNGENVSNLSEITGHTIFTGYPTQKGYYFFNRDDTSKATTFYKVSLDLQTVEELLTINEEVKYFLSVSTFQNYILYNVLGPHNHDIHKVDLESGKITPLVADN